MRFTLIMLAVTALSACSTDIPQSQSGVGFNDYGEYLAQKQAQQAQLARRSAPPPTPVSPSPAPAGDQTVIVSNTQPSAGQDVAADTRAVLNETGSGSVVTGANTAAPAPNTVSTASGISSENDFEAVGAERSIESDAALIASNRQQYKVIAPEALPTRSGGSGPNIVQYALNTRHPVGTRVHRRIGANREAKYRRNCGKYPSPDRAQEEFLSKGGPDRDNLGLDPDGDGYACSWDPAPFRKAVGG